MIYEDQAFYRLYSDRVAPRETSIRLVLGHNPELDKVSLHSLGDGS